MPSRSLSRGAFACDSGMVPNHALRDQPGHTTSGRHPGGMPPLTRSVYWPDTTPRRGPRATVRPRLDGAFVDKHVPEWRELIARALERG